MYSETIKWLDEVDWLEDSILKTAIKEVAKELDQKMSPGLMAEWRRLYQEIQRMRAVESEEDELDSILDDE